MACGVGGSSVRERVSAWIFALAASLACSCAVHRRLIVVSEPEGAKVRLDQNLVGETPYTTEFEAFGTRRVTLYKDGYRTWSKSVKLSAPWYARFPFDLFSEMLIPVGWTYEKKVTATLEPEIGQVPLPDLERVLDRAEVLRKAGPEGPQRETPAPPPE